MDKYTEKKLVAFYAKDARITPPALYDTYDYASFWKGRAFEQRADSLAISRLIKRIPLPHNRILDIGAGTGRIAPLYEHKWEHCILLDPSHVQLMHAKKKVSREEGMEFIEGTIESIPLADASCDAAICIRAFHYVPDIHRAIKEVARILSPGGYFILEIPNKIHFKNRIKAIFSPNLKKEMASHDPISRAVEDKSVVFLNHHPDAIINELLMSRFEIMSILSVSNFRSPLLKKITPVWFILLFETVLQRPLSYIWFGPSIYFLARKKSAG